MQYQWYPGHMTKARRMMEENIKLIDLVIELADARIPQSSRNPDIQTLAADRARIILLNKADLADEKATAAWISFYQSENITAIPLNSKARLNKRIIDDAVILACSAKLQRDQARGIKNRPVRAMVVGIPNVGKSTFINAYAGKACAKTGNKPGVTKGKQWIRLGHNIELLDTPGILWPRFNDETTGRNLALIGSMNDEILNTEELAFDLICFLQDRYPGVLADHYDISEEVSPEEADNMAIPGGPKRAAALLVMDRIALRRGCIRRKAEPDYEKTCALILDDFRNGRLGRISLEFR